MKIGGSKKKKGVSAVVATVLIVMITVLAVGIIWITILPMIRENLAVSDVCENAGVSIISSQGYTCYKPNNITMVQVSKGNSEVNVTGLKFSVSMDGNSYDYDNQKVEYSTAEYNVYYLNTSEFAKIEKISVVPTVKLGDSDKSCSAIFLDNVPLCSSNVNLVEASAGRLIGRSSGVVTNIEPPCDNSCSCAADLLVGQNCTNGCTNVCYGTKRDGSILAPFAIYSWTDLNNTRNNLSASYELMNNLDENTVGYDIYASSSANDGMGWEPLGNSTSGYRFSGNFNGNNYNISGLYISRPSNNNIGLFGYSTGNISNIGLVDINISGYSSVGGLVGYQYNGSISNSYSTGNVTGNNNVGGLVGYQYNGSISNSYSTGKITGNSGVGGLVGYHNVMGSISFISNSYSTNEVFGSGDYVGGLVGRYSGSISNCYSTGNVYSTNFVGGFIGFKNYGVISNSYSTGNVTGNNNVGGFAGYGNYATISRSYSTGKVSSAGIVGGFLGFKNEGTVSYAYWDIYFSGKSVCYNGGTVTGCSSTNNDISAYQGASGVSKLGGGSEWVSVEGEYPTLMWQN